jgi:hypothetical protein
MLLVVGFCFAQVVCTNDEIDPKTRRTRFDSKVAAKTPPSLAENRDCKRFDATQQLHTC